MKHFDHVEWQQRRYFGLRSQLGGRRRRQAYGTIESFRRFEIRQDLKIQEA